MSTRIRLEEELAAARERIENAPKDTPADLLRRWREEYDTLSFELNNLYDDEVNEFTE